MCIATNFLVLWFNLKLKFNGPEYLTREAAQVYVHLMRFMLNSSVLRSLLVRWKWHFLIFFFYWCPLPLFSSSYNFPFLRTLWLFLDFGRSISLVNCPFLPFITSLAHFSMSLSNPISWLYILIPCVWFNFSFSFLQTVWCSSYTWSC